MVKIFERHRKKMQKSIMRSLLEDMQFVAMDNVIDVNFHFNEEVSFIINDRDQQKMNYYWNKY